MVKCYRKDYPRPQFVRDNWQNLNGAWDFAFDDANSGEANGWGANVPAEREIQVPFTYQTKMSGIGDETEHDHVWYQKKFTVSMAELGTDRLLLHLEGCDYITKVWLNGKYLGSHEGGYARFSFDLTDALRDGENNLVVKADDSPDEAQARGKQRWEPQNFGCWYLDTTGIWKTVWLEKVPARRLESVKITPHTRARTVAFDFIVNAEDLSGLFVEAEVTFDGRFVNSVRLPVTYKQVHTELDLDNTAICQGGVMQWRPGRPNLYDVEFRLIADNAAIDTAGSYFGMREIRIDHRNILLNGNPLYQRLILDQGYWKDSNLTPPSEEALIEDIDKILALGYNGLRKHQKIEDERFLYWCDVKGVLVWSEMAATYRFNDTAAESFTRQWMEIVRQNYNHPSIITWTPVNESWGVPRVKTDRTEQHFTEAIYHLTKSLDATRPVIVNDGWEHTVSDIITLHDYEASGKVFFDRYNNYAEEILSSEIFHNLERAAFADGFEDCGQPVIISEYGGIAFNNGESGWGYGDKVQGEEAFLARFDSITTAIKELPYVCGYCYTQVTDVQQEVNGLMDMDRNFKISPEKISEINKRVVPNLK